MSQIDVAWRTLTVLTPEMILILTATVMMTAGAFVQLPRRVWAAVAAAALAAALVALIALRGVTLDPYSAVALNDAFSGYARLAFLLTGIVIVALAHDQVGDNRASEFFGAMLLIEAGSMIVAATNDIVVLFAGLELVSLPTYLLLYLSRRNAQTLEAVTKYFYLSIFSSALLVFGLAYLYGLTGVTNLRALSYLIDRGPAAILATDGARATFSMFGTIALVFVMAGLSFRVAAVPFHFYAPDVYQGSPTVIAALLAWVPKGIGFLAIVRALTAVFGGSNAVAAKGLVLAWILATITMILGNALALLQDNLKRLLAYSSIAHAGYLMVGVAVAFIQPVGVFSGSEGVLFYLAAYALMTLGAFGVILALDTPERPVETVEDLAGLGWTHPAAALAMALCLFSLAGVPPLAGFWGKFWVFSSAFLPERAAGAPSLRLLAIIGVLNSAVGAYYYLRIVVLMYFQPAPSRPLAPRAGWPTVVAVGACASLSLALGLFPWPLARASREAAVAAASHPRPAAEAAPAPMASAARPVPAR